MPALGTIVPSCLILNKQEKTSLVLAVEGKEGFDDRPSFIYYKWFNSMWINLHTAKIPSIAFGHSTLQAHHCCRTRMTPLGPTAAGAATPRSGKQPETIPELVF